MNKKIAVFGILVMFLLTSFFVSTVTSIKIDVKTNEKADMEKISFYETTDSSLPSYFSWRDIDGVDFTTPIRNQIRYPSCESFALLGALETMVQYEVGYPFGCDLSEAHLYFFSGGNLDWGSYPENDTDFLVEYGVPDEACWPYPRDRFQHPLNTTSPDWQSRTVKITNWSYLPEDPIAIKNALVNNGPVPTYFHPYEDFPYHRPTVLNQGMYRHRWGKSSGAHYITIVGYNDDPGYWICKNSWGLKYPKGGWFNIAYGECSIEKKSIYLSGVYGQFPILYVDDDNTMGPWDGSKNHPYQTIQDGIDNAYEGYAVYVYNGTYYENVLINKTINLDGENKTITIIDGNNMGHVIDISVPDVRVSGFTIQNSGNIPFDSGIKTRSLNSNVIIKNNIIQDNDLGVFLNYAYEQSGNIVEDNLIQNNNDGIYAHWANNNNIKNNIIQNNTGDGIEFECSQFATISNNIIKNNGECGIYLRYTSNQNHITCCKIENNDIGVKIEKSIRNIVTGNGFIDNDQQAIFFHSYFNRWNGNYWNDWIRISPRIITGSIGYLEIPWINVDWCPLHPKILS
jgi:parallel beta-helix repeat protein